MYPSYRDIVEFVDGCRKGRQRAGVDVFWSPVDRLVDVDETVSVGEEVFIVSEGTTDVSAEANCRLRPGNVSFLCRISRRWLAEI